MKAIRLRPAAPWTSSSGTSWRARASPTTPSWPTRRPSLTPCFCFGSCSAGITRWILSWTAARSSCCTCPLSMCGLWTPTVTSPSRWTSFLRDFPTCWKGRGRASSPIASTSLKTTLTGAPSPLSSRSWTASPTASRRLRLRILFASGTPRAATGRSGTSARSFTST